MYIGVYVACTRRGEAREATNTVPYLVIRVRVPLARPNSASFYVISPDIAHPLFSFFLPSCQPPRLIVGQSTSDRARMEKARRFSVGEEAEERAQGEADRAESRKPTLRVALSLAICWRVTEIGAGARTIGVLLG